MPILGSVASPDRSSSSPPSDSPSRLVAISESSNAFSSLPHRVFKYISTHTKESLLALSVLGFAIVIEKKPSLLIYPAALAAAAGAAKKAVDYFQLKTDMNDKEASHDAEVLDPKVTAGEEKLRAFKSRSKPPTLQEIQDSYVLAFLTDQLLIPGSKSIFRKKYEDLYINALAKLAPKVSITDFTISLFDILTELELLDPEIEKIDSLSTEYSNHEIENCLHDAILTITKTYKKFNTPVGAHLQLCKLSFGIYYNGKKFTLYNPKDSIPTTFHSDKLLIEDLNKNEVFERYQSYETEESISFSLNLFTKKSEDPSKSLGKGEVDHPCGDAEGDGLSAADIAAIEGQRRIEADILAAQQAAQQSLEDEAVAAELHENLNKGSPLLDYPEVAAETGSHSHEGNSALTEEEKAFQRALALSCEGEFASPADHDEVDPATLSEIEKLAERVGFDYTILKLNATLVQSTLAKIDWKTSMAPDELEKLDECFLKFGIDESVINEIWIRFPFNLEERLKLLSQKVSAMHKECFLETDWSIK